MELDQAAKDFLIDKGYNPDFGARPLRRAIGQYIEDPLSEMLLSGEISGRTLLKVTRKDEDENLYFNAESLPEPPKDEGSDGDGSEGDKPVSAGAEST